jgi:hypothetical protein
VVIEVKSNGSAHVGETIIVNLHGALVQVPAALKLGDRITIHVPHTGKSAVAVVVFVEHEVSQFGMELEHPENIWGVVAPPDWLTN